MFSVGVTVITAVIGVVPVLIAVKEGTLVVPFAASPIAGLELVQAYVAPAGVLVNVTAATVAPLQVTTFAGTVTVGAGLIVTTTGEMLEHKPTVFRI